MSRADPIMYFCWGVLSSIVLGGRESLLHGEGLDGSTQPAKETCTGHVGSEYCKPTSLRGIADKAKAVRLARKRVQPRNPAIAGENFTSGSARGVPGNRHSYRGCKRKWHKVLIQKDQLFQL